MKLIVCLIPEGSAAKAIITLASSQPQMRQEFYVDGATSYAHLSVYHGHFTEGALSSVISRLRHLPHLDNGVRCRAYGLTLSSGGYLEIGYDRSSLLEALQDQIVEAISSQRLKEPVKNELDPLDREAILRTGYQFAGDNFRPHITLCHYEEAETHTVQLATDLTELDFAAEHLYLCTAGDFGSAVQILARIPMT